jgi:heme-degrading monooxygenase HmoA
VRAGAEKLFTAGYGADGKWAQLFRKAAGFEGTELARSVEDERSFYTFDHWQSEQAFERFRKEYASEYATLDREFEELTESEQFIGSINR